MNFLLATFRIVNDFHLILTNLVGAGSLVSERCSAVDGMAPELLNATDSLRCPRSVRMLAGVFRTRTYREGAGID